MVWYYSLIIRRSIILLFGAFAFIACNKKEAAVGITTPPIVIVTPPFKKYLALGDSYTIGQSATAPERYPYIAASTVRQDNIVISEPQYIATTGWTTANLEAAIDAANLANDYSIVTLLIGVNDQYQGVDTAVYRTRFTRLLNKSVSLAANNKERVIVLSIPDYSVTPFVAGPDKARVSAEIDYFNAINKEVTLSYNISYINITDLSREAANDPALLTGDQLHYTGREYQKWAALLVPLMEAKLK